MASTVYGRTTSLLDNLAGGHAAGQIHRPRYIDKVNAKSAKSIHRRRPDRLAGRFDDISTACHGRSTILYLG